MRVTDYARSRLQSRVLALFRSGRPGGSWRVHPRFCWQNVAGTIPSLVNDPVARWDDWTGRAYQYTQATSTARPTLKLDASGQYMLSGDGVDDGLASPVINFSGSDKLLAVSAARKRADANGCILELSSVYTSNNGSFAIIAGAGSIANYDIGLRGTANADRRIPVAAQPHLAIISAPLDIAGTTRDDEIKSRFNGVAWTSNSGGTLGPAGTGNFGSSYALNTLRRGNGSGALLGDIYGHTVIGGAWTVAEAELIERFHAECMGGMPP